MDVRIRNVIFLKVRRIVYNRVEERSEGKREWEKKKGEERDGEWKKMERFLLVKKFSFPVAQFLTIAPRSNFALTPLHSLWKNSRKIGVNRRDVCSFAVFSSMLGCVSEKNEKIIFLNEVSFFFPCRNGSEVVRIA